MVVVLVSTAAMAALSTGTLSLSAIAHVKAWVKQKIVPKTRHTDSFIAQSERNPAPTESYVNCSVKEENEEIGKRCPRHYAVFSGFNLLTGDGPNSIAADELLVEAKVAISSENKRVNTITSSTKMETHFDNDTTAREWLSEMDRAANDRRSPAILVDELMRQVFNDRMELEWTYKECEQVKKDLCETVLTQIQATCELLKNKNFGAKQGCSTLPLPLEDLDKKLEGKLELMEKHTQDVLYLPFSKKLSL